MMKKMIQLILKHSLLILILSFIINGQTTQEEIEKPSTYSITTVILDSAAISFRSESKSDEYLIIVGGSSQGEKSKYNEQRLQDAVEYFRRIQKIEEKKIVRAIGTESKTDIAYLKIFISGKLVGEIKTVKGGRLCFGHGETLSVKSFQVNFYSHFLKNLPAVKAAV